jgi:hypothetical protein
VVFSNRNEENLELNEEDKLKEEALDIHNDINSSYQATKYLNCGARSYPAIAKASYIIRRRTYSGSLRRTSNGHQRKMGC